MYEQTTTAEIKTAEKIVAITLALSSTIAHLKDLIKEETGHAPDHQVLCMMSKEMNDDQRTLADYRVKDKDELTLTSKVDAEVPEISP